MLLLAPASVLAASQTALSPDQTRDCVIRDFQSLFTVRLDASLAVTEDITADCGALPDKHGIFRILPTRASRPSGQYTGTPITLQSITDFAGNSVPYTTIHKGTDHTLTWKIGDADVTIQGVHQYRIKYLVANAVNVASNDKVEFYWNLNGSFWQLPIEHYLATVVLPKGLTHATTTLTLTSGQPGAKGNTLAGSSWPASDTFRIESNTTLYSGDGITARMVFPTGIITLYTPSFWQRYQDILVFAFPLMTLMIGYLIWRRFGRDPRPRGPVMVEYAPPQKLLPLELAAIDSGGSVNNRFVTATIIDMAVRGYLTIQEVEGKKILGFTAGKDWTLARTAKSSADLSAYEQEVLRGVFPADGTGDTTNLSGLRTTLSPARPRIISLVSKNMTDRKIFDRQSQVIAILWGAGGLIGSFLLAYLASIYLDVWAIIACVLSGLAALAFAYLMPRRTPLGADLEYQTKGFKLYLSKAEKYRMEFYEKEHIFEKYLPYAIAFGMTGLWIAAIKSIYGDRYTSMMPAWYLASGGVGGFDSFASSLDSISSQMAAATSPASSGGGGFSGGGGGGGGGGSW